MLIIALKKRQKDGYNPNFWRFFRVDGETSTCFAVIEACASFWNFVEKGELSMSKNVDNDETALTKITNLGSTFATVRANKSAPIQSLLDRLLPTIIGRCFLLVDAEKQENTDPNNGQVTKSALYTVRVISKKAQAYREMIQIKVKNSEPIIRGEELDQIMMQNIQPIVLRFENIAHYAYMGGEIINASVAEKMDISVKEAMNYE